MSKLWLKDSGLVLASGALTRCATCPCVVDCTRGCQNSDAPSEFEVTISGSTILGNPTAYDGTWVLPFFQDVPVICTWQESWANLNGNPQSISGMQARVQAAGGSTVAVSVLVCNNVTHQAVVPYDCLSIDHTLTIQTPGMTCGEGDAIVWPSTVNLKAR